jgi:hypothetical protein
VVVCPKRSFNDNDRPEALQRKSISTHFVLTRLHRSPPSFAIRNLSRERAQRMFHKIAHAQRKWQRRHVDSSP